MVAALTMAVPPLMASTLPPEMAAPAKVSTVADAPEASFVGLASDAGLIDRINAALEGMLKDGEAESLATALI
jgi:hypothetical protein